MRGQIAILANWASSKFVKSKGSFTFQSLYSIFTLVLWSKILRFPLFEINGDTRISSTSGTKRGLFWLSLLPGELLVAGEVTNEPTRPERLSRIKDFGLWGSGDSRLQKKYSKMVKLVHKLVKIRIYLLVSLFTNRSWKLGRPLSLGKDI